METPLDKMFSINCKVGQRKKRKKTVRVWSDEGKRVHSERMNITTIAP